jgi:hypothetical protein
MNKFILNIELTKDFGINVEIVLWDKRFLYDPECKNIKTGLYDFFNDGDFMIFSFGEGYISDFQFVIPQLEHYKCNYKLSYNFYDEEERYNYLKKLYNCLNKWGQYWNDILRNQDVIYNEEIKINGPYWIM